MAILQTRKLKQMLALNTSLVGENLGRLDQSADVIGRGCIVPPSRPCKDARGVSTGLVLYLC